MRDIQVFLGFDNFYLRFIQDFSKIARSLALILIITSLTGLSIILQLLINAADGDEVGRGESGGNKTNLLNPSASKRSIGADYLTSKGAKNDGNNRKKSGSNITKGVKAVRDSDYLTPNTKKVFNHLRHIFIQALIFQYFDPECHIWIQTNASGYAIDRVLN